MSARIPAVTGALLIALLVPASAQAVTIAPLKPCYVTAGTAEAPQQEGVTIQAAGFTANSTVTIAVNGQPIGSPPQEFQTDASGNLNLPPNSVPAPFVESGTHEFPITLTEVNNPVNTATVTSKSTALDVSVKPKRARPSKRIRFKGSGFTGEQPVYAHYVFKNKLRKTVRMARKTGTCGAWSARKRQIPVNEPKPGLWTVQFDQSKRYIADVTKIPSVFVRLGISVTLVPQRG